MLNAACSDVNGPALQTGGMLTLDRLKELIRAVEPTATGRELAWLGPKISVSHQAMNNWEARGVACGNWIAIADALKLSLDELLGRRPPAWPFELVSYEQWQALNERQRGAVEYVAAKEIRSLLEQSRKPQDPAAA
jgi:hypothetical protein